MMWLAFGLGLFLGTIAGIFVVALLQAGARSRRDDVFFDRGACDYEPVGQPAFADELK